jgi:hypothetical protein
MGAMIRKTGCIIDLMEVITGLIKITEGEQRRTKAYC